jgi:uncharacterized protein YigA (DUF484 family)
MTKQAISAARCGQTEETIIEYLRSHPDFFIRHEYLLQDLKLPHQSGRAISLGERQVQVFREHRDTLKKQLDELISIARENDVIFKKSKRLLLDLLEVRSLDEIHLVVREAFRQDPNIDFSSIIVLGERTDYPVSDIQVLNQREARDALGTLLDSTSAVCGQFNPRQLHCIFGVEAGLVGSAAVIPLRNGNTLGLFCLGSRSQSHFDSSMGSLFLSYISDFISRILPELLSRSKSQKTAEQIPSLLE